MDVPFFIVMITVAGFNTEFPTNFKILLRLIFMLKWEFLFDIHDNIDNGGAMQRIYHYFGLLDYYERLCGSMIRECLTFLSITVSMGIILKIIGLYFEDIEK